MKMHPEHYTTIRAEFEKNGTKLSQAWADYQKNGLSLQRFLWDAFRFCRIAGNSTTWVCDVLYPSGLNDTHVETALKTAAKSIGITA